MLALTAAISASLGCSPSVSELKAEPNVVCRGGSVRLSWAASTSGTLSATPQVAGMGAVEATGSRTVSPTETTRFHLAVSSLFGHDGRDVDVVVQAASPVSKTLTRSLADPSAGCDEHTFFVTAVAPSDFWDPHLRVGQVSSADGRRYHVEHAGRSADVAPGAPSNAFDGVEVAGDWKLTSPVGPDEKCHEKGPPNLMIGLVAACAP